MASEFELIRRHFSRATPGAVLGGGDDCALLAPRPGHELAVTSDMLVAGTHFYADTNPADLGWKTLAVNLSDLAAMGAVPRWVLLAMSLPEADETWLAAFAAGFYACASAYGVDLVGGDTTRGPLSFSVTALGETRPGAALRRDGGRAGDDIWVSGRPGLAGLGLAQLQGKVELPEPWRRLCLAALHKPRPRLALGQALTGIATSAIDVSDGLLADLGHIGERSGLAAQVDLVRLPHLPPGVDRALALHCQLAGGDDYELCFTASPAAQLAIGAIAAQLELPLWCIGSLVEGTPGSVSLLDPDGKPVDIDTRGFDHFG
ncbi:MAG: thiamine-phosphate kinase [Pseudomonadota bacterium]|jgi:thiamine-monophosphate kinase